MKKEKPRYLPNLSIPDEANEMLIAFCEKHPEMTKTDVVRAALHRFLPKLIAGEMIIANGKLVTRDELQAA